MAYENDPRLGILNIATLCGIELLDRLSAEEVKARCPFCGDSTNPRHGHLNLNISSDAYRCVRCGTGGFAVGLYARLSGISTKEAYKEIIDSKRVAIEIKAPKIKQHLIADIKDRDAVYRSLLNKLTLTKKHRANLLRRGLSEFDLKSYKSAEVGAEEKVRISQAIRDEGHTLKGVPGFYVNEDGQWTFIGSNGFLIPVLNLYGKIEGLKIRKDGIPDGRKYRWISSKSLEEGTAARAWFHVAWSRNKDTKKVCITEGPLKAEIAAKLSNTTFIALPGVGIYKNVTSILNRMKDVEIVPIAFDMDKDKNVQVKKHLNNLVKLLKKAGYKTKIVSWDAEYKGIDDYLLYLATKQKQLKKAE